MMQMRLVKTARLTLGWVWALALLLAGWWLWGFAAGQSPEYAGAMKSLAMVLMAGAQFVFMVLVADAWYPRAPVVCSGLLKLTAGFVVWGGLAVAAYRFWEALL